MPAGVQTVTEAREYNEIVKFMLIFYKIGLFSPVIVDKLIYNEPFYIKFAKVAK